MARPRWRAAHRPGRRAPARPGRGTPPSPRRSPGRACPDRRPRRRRSPGRRTTGTCSRRSRPHDPLRVRPAVRIEQDRQRRPVAGRRRSGAATAVEMPRSPARSNVTLGRTNGASARLASSGPPSTRVKDRSCVERGRPGHDDLAAPEAGVHPRLDQERLGRGAVAEAPEAHVGRIVDRVGREEQRAADHGDDGSDLEVGRGERHAGGDEPPGALVIRCHHHPAVVEQAGAPDTSSTHASSCVLEEDRRVATGGIGGQHLKMALIAALHGQHDPVLLGPLHVGQVRERARGPTGSRAGRRRGRAPRASHRHWPSPPPGRRARSAACWGRRGR